MKITVGQFNVKAKDIKFNFSEMQKLIDQAIIEEYEMIVFGEYALSGFACADLFKDADFIDEVSYYQNKLKNKSDKITIIFGGLIVEEESLYSTAIIYDKEKSYYSSKENLSKREFNESSYFTLGLNKVVTLNNVKYLITFKADLDNVSNHHYDKLIIIDSSPVNHTVQTDLFDNVVYANLLGVSAISKVVWINGGNSFVKTDNEIYGFTKALEQGIINSVNKVVQVSKLQALTKGIKVWSDQTFGENKKWLLGSSGGLDSAVTTALLAISLGSENVITYNLASKYNKDLTINNARLLSDKLKIAHYENSIQSLVDQAYTTLSDFGYPEISTFDQENIQARTRGHLLSAFSALENTVISNNGNKLELVLGYATMYGDTIGALSLIGDLSKVEVFELAKEINDFCQDEIIPQNLLPKVDNYKITWEMPPSAELKDDQIDPMKWYYHDLLLELILSESLEMILERYLKDQFLGLELGKWLEFYDLLDGKNFIDDFNWFTKTMQINHFKRLQTPPVLAYGDFVLGFDYKESSNLLPKSQKYLSLEKAIIEKH